MSIEDAILQEVQQSLNRCSAHGTFFDKFCSNFKAANLPIPPMPGRQQKFLKEDLARLVMGMRKGQDSRPGAQALNVPPQLSRYWIDALMATVRECDERFTPELERKWRMVLNEGMACASRTKFPA